MSSELTDRSHAFEWEERWPQRRERRPSFVDPYFLHYSALTRSLLVARDRYVDGPVEVLDVGCGDMPYFPLFTSVAADYAGVDVEHGPGVRYVCPVEDLDIPDASFDLVLCTQVLEHVRDPNKALREIARVLRPGGYAFLTTHGVWPFHPYPGDYWRWTQQGLEALFDRVSDLRLVELIPHRGTVSCLALLLNYNVDIAARRTKLVPVGHALCAALNLVGIAGDRVGRLNYPLIHNFLAVARRARADERAGDGAVVQRGVSGSADPADAPDSSDA